jgi:hypothetical protein
MIDTTTATLTLERFAALESAWPATIAVTGGLLLARIHRRNNRPHGDEDVLARALVFIPPHTYGPIAAWDKSETTCSAGYLARLTIRTTNLTGDDYGQAYVELLKIVLALPVIEFS